MFNQGELVNLILGVSIIPILVMHRAGVPSRHTNFFVIAYAFMLLSYISTVAEGYYAPVLFNLVEHGSLAVAGCAFAFGLFLRRRELEQILKER